MAKGQTEPVLVMCPHCGDILETLKTDMGICPKCWKSLTFIKKENKDEEDRMEQYVLQECSSTG